MSRQFFREQLDALMNDTLALGSRVEATFAQALRAVMTNDLDQMHRLISDDRQINSQTQALHQRCLTLIARQQPMAGDLREISVVLSLLPELERMADHAATCCKIGRRMNNEPGFLPLQAMAGSFPRAIPEMGERVLRLLHNGLDALARRDADYAVRICQDDHEIDGPAEVEGPIERGERIGRATVLLDDRAVGTVPLIAARAIAEPTLVDRVGGPGVVVAAALLLIVILIVAAYLVIRRRGLGRGQERSAEDRMRSRHERDRRRDDG